MGKYTHSLESATRKQIDLMLKNVDWIIDESNPNCNVFTERAKLVTQNKKLKGNKPDFVLYESGTDTPIAIIEAKRKGQSIESALDQAINKYAQPLGVNLVFALDGTFVKTLHLSENKPLTIDNELLTEIPSEQKLLRFLKEGANIAEVTAEVKHTREELIKIFKWANDLLRKEGLRNLDRFVEFANILFIKIISEIEDEREKNGQIRKLGKEVCWDSFAHMKNPKMMLNYINDTVLKNGLAKEYNHTDDIFQEQLKIKNASTIKEIVEKLSQLQLLNTESEIKGDAFEYFLKNLASGNDLGEYFTPRHIVKLIVELVNPKYGNTIFDPFCGTGGFLIEVFRRIKRSIDENNKSLMTVLKERSIFGIELTDTYKIAKMNMIITGDGHNNIIQDDTAKNVYWNHKDLRKVLEANNITGFDCILSNIPYGQSTDYGDLYPVPSNKGDSIFIQHIIQALNKDGRCGVIIPEGFLFNNEFEKVREYLLKECNVEAIISLPAGIFLPYTMAKTDILIFQKGTPTKRTWFYTLENDGYELATKRKKINKNDIPDLKSKWLTKPDSENSWNADITKIEKNHYVLEAKTYQPTKIKTHQQTEFSKFLRQVKRPIKLQDKTKYKQVTVRLHGNGAILRTVMDSREIRTKNQFAVKEGDVIVSKIDARNGAYAVIGKELDGAIVTSDFPVFEIDRKQIRQDYLEFFLKYYDFAVELAKNSKGTTNRRRIKVDDFLNLSIPLPSLAVQEDLVNRLKDQEDILFGLEYTLVSLNKGFIDQSLFELSDVSYMPLKELIVKSQYGLCKSVMPTKKGVPFIRITDIDAFGRINPNLPEISASKYQIETYKVNKDDILIARTGATIGKGTVIDSSLKNAVFASYLIRLVVDKEKIRPKYLLYYLLSNKGKEEILSRAKRTTNVNINVNRLLSIEIPLPKTIYEQEIVVNKIDGRLQFINSIEQNIEDTRATLHSLIHEIHQDDS